MALHRGIQSAIFYYLSCAPCAEARYRKKRKQEAVRGRADREALEAEMPNLYRHPSPSSTNPHWQAEIAAGPTLSNRGKRKNTTNTSLGNGGGGGSRGALKTSMTEGSGESNIPSSVDLSSNRESRDGRYDSKCNFQQYQRADEELSERLASRSTLASAVSEITRPPRARTRSSEADRSYRSYRNPAINDLHPAIATKVDSREEARWMMQPPPHADYMSGKERSLRSRSDSGGSSRLSARSGVPLSREVSHKIIDRKIRSGEVLPSPGMSRESSAQTANDPNGQRHERIAATEEKDFAFDEPSPRKRERRRKPSPIQIQVSEDSSDSAVTVLRNTNFVPESIRKQSAQRRASRPRLSTIISDSTVAASDTDDFYTPAETPKENSLPNSARHSSESSLPDHDRTARRSALVVKDDPSPWKQPLADLTPTNPVFNSQVVSPQDLDLRGRDVAFAKTRIRMPSDASDNHIGGPELYDSWYTPDFALPDWVHQHTTREVRHRWSMDI